jgi:hypothetical protein
MTLSRGDSPWFLAFCPNGAQGDSPGQRPVGSSVEIESRPERGGTQRRGKPFSDVPRSALRFALGYLILPLWRGETKNPLSRGDCPRLPVVPLRRQPAPGFRRDPIHEPEVVEAPPPVDVGEKQKGLSRQGRTAQHVRFRDRIGRQRRKQTKHSARPPRGDSRRFLVSTLQVDMIPSSHGRQIQTKLAKNVCSLGKKSSCHS